MLPAALDLQPGVYAVVGATAMLGATFRSSISLVVIVVEGTVRRTEGAMGHPAHLRTCLGWAEGMPRPPMAGSHL